MSMSVIALGIIIFLILAEKTSANDQEVVDARIKILTQSLSHFAAFLSTHGYTSRYAKPE